MRLLFFTDCHLDERAPSSRGSHYQDEIFAKLAEVKEIARSVDLTISGGDWFHRPNVVDETKTRLIEFLRDWPTPLYTCLGNHDLNAQGMAGLRRTSVELVLEALRGGPLHLLTDDVVVRVGTETVQLSAAHWRHGIEADLESVSIEPLGADLRIKVIHAMVLPGGGWPFPALPMDELHTEADIVLLGHYHGRLGIFERGGTQYVGPGSITRTQRTDAESLRIPAVAIIDGRQVEIRELQSAKPAAEVFVWKEPGGEKPAEAFEGYVQALESGLQLDGLSVEDALDSISKQEDPEVIVAVRDLLARSGL